MRKLPGPALLFIIGALFYTGITRAQNFNFQTYSLEQGLSQSEVNCIFEDSRGYLWMGTSGGGINRFDGLHFVSYEEDDGLCGQIVTAVAEDKKGELWIGTTWGGICHFDGRIFAKLSDSEGLLSTNIKCLMFDDKDNLFIGTAEGLSIYGNDGNPKSEKKFRHFLKDEKTFVPIRVKCFEKDKQGNIWIGTENGVYLWKNDKLINLTASFRQLNGSVQAIAVDTSGNIFIAENPGLFFKLSSVSTSFMYEVQDIPLPGHAFKSSVSAMHFDTRGRLWICTLGDGIIRIQDGKETDITRNNGLSNNVVASICEGASGNLWFGTRGEGVMKYRDDRFLYYDNIPGLKEGDIFAINKDAKGNLWIGTSTTGAFVFNGKEVKSLNACKEIAEGRTSSFYFAPNGDVWIGTSSGIIVYNGSSFRRIKLVDTANVLVRAIYEDRKKNVWVGTTGYGLIRMNGEKPELFTGKNSVSANVYSFAEDKKGTLYIGTGAGLYTYDGSNIHSYMEGLCNSYTGSLVMDKYDHLWVGTDKCVARFDGTKFTSYSVADGLTSNTVYLMNVDEDGHLWVGTNKGIDRLTVSADGKLLETRNYNRAEGFKGIECNSRATYRDKDGALYFGTVKGLIRYDSKEDKTDLTVPNVHITDVRVNFEKISWEKFGDSLSPWFNLPVGHDFSYGQNHLTFDFIGISKTIPEAVQYQFMLEGFDEEWSRPVGQNSVTYSNLPAGDYAFKVKAANADGKWDEIPAEFKFSILAPFWRTTGFILICIAALGAAIYYYNRLRKVQIRKRNMVLERLVKERTSELQKQKEEREVLLKEIHHRVKNNLQIVNSLINIQSANIKDPEALAVFEESKSKIKSIALIHERLYKGQDLSNIEIGDYLSELMKSLVETYSVNKNIKLVTDLKVQKLNLNTVIPLGLLLNEIISNSIKYAFKEMTGGEIYIQLKAVDDNTYEMTIGDNGKGFDADPFEGENPTLGLELVKILVDQLDGSIKKLDHAGTYYFIRFQRAKS